MIRRIAVAWTVLSVALLTAHAASIKEIKEICECTSAECQRQLFSALSDDDAYVRTYAASCLEKQESVDPDMLNEAMNSSDARVIALALRIYAKHGSCTELLGRYLNHKLAAVRAQAAYAAGKLKCVQFDRKLVDMVWDRHISVRSQVIVALGRIGSDSTLPKVLVFLNSPHDQVAQAAIKAAVMYGDRAVEPLRRLVANGESAELRVRAALALGAITTPRASVALRELLESRDRSAVGAALYTLKFRRDRSLIPQIREHLDDNRRFGRYGTLSELAKAALENQK